MRTLSHLALITKNAQSIKTTVPRNVVKKMNLAPTDILEWSETKDGEFTVRKLR
jgi:hypothetical protein